MSWLNSEIQKAVIQEYIHQNHQGEELRAYIGCTEPNWKTLLFGVFVAQIRHIGVTDKRIVVIPVTLSGKPKPNGDILDIPLEQVTKFEHTPLFNLIVHYGPNTKRKFQYAGVPQANNAKHLVDTFNDLRHGLKQG